jgi:Ca-activated chloride channel family protein
MKLVANLTRDAFRFDQENTGHLVVSLTAPAIQAARPRICILPVIDVSGSMAGAKLDYAKKSVLKLIDHLAPGDYAGLIAFESRVHTPCIPREVTEATKNALRTEVGKLRTLGGTNFSGGLLAALDMVKNLDLPSGVLLRVIMFTDGQANEGVAQRPEDLIKLLESNMERVSVSAFGYGDGGGIDQDFLGKFATAGKGNYAYIKDPDAALAAFGKELGGLLSTYAMDLVLEVTPLNGHQISEVISDVDAEEEDVTGEITIKVPDILAQETRNIVFTVKLAEQKQALPRAVNLFDVKLRFARLGESATRVNENAEAKVKVTFVKQGEEGAANKDLDAIVALAQVAQAQVAAEEQAKQGNFIGAQHIVQAAAASVGARGHDRLRRHAVGLVDRLADARVYSANAGYMASTSRGMTRGMGVASYDASAQEDLAELGVVTSNVFQADMADSFSAPVDSSIGISSSGDAPSPFDGSSPLMAIPAVIPVPEQLEEAAPAPKARVSKKRSTVRW